MNTGFSLYCANGYETNATVVAKAKAAGCRYAFTSLHIPEEEGIDYRAETVRLLKLCKDAGIDLIADISPVTLKKLGITDFTGLEELGITYVRLDFGFSAKETVALSKRFHIVFNASTISREDIIAWQAAGADFTRFTACHNFYPKRFSALSLERVAKINERLKTQGFQTMAFVPGETYRGPLHEGLPTVESHRGDTGDKLVCDMLALYDAAADVVMIGDSDVSHGVWNRIRQLSENCLEIRVKLSPEYEYLYDRDQHDRLDSSEYFIRSQESRLWDDAPVYGPTVKPVESAVESVPAGTVLVSNSAYGRYAGELSIARTELPLDARDTVAGHVVAADMEFLPYLHLGRGFKLIR